MSTPRGDDAAEGGRAVERHGEVPVEDPREDPVGELTHLVDAGRLDHPGDDVVHLRDGHPGPVVPGRDLGLTLDPLPDEVHAPQCAGEAACGPAGPQLGQGVDPEVVDEPHEPVRRGGRRSLTAGLDDRERGGVGRLGDLRHVGDHAEASAE